MAKVSVNTAYLVAINERTQHPLVQSGKVFGESICAGCGLRGVWLIDDCDAWCPSCGGSELVAGAIDLDYGPFDSHKVRLDSSAVVHLVLEPQARTTRCMPLATIGRMRGASRDAGVTCSECTAIRDGDRS